LSASHNKRLISIDSRREFRGYADWQSLFMDMQSAWLIPNTEIWSGPDLVLKINALGCKGPELEPGLPVIAFFGVKTARRLVEEGKGADGYEKARTILEKIIAQKDSSEGKINAQNLLKQLLQQHLQLEGEKVNLPDQPFRMLVNYRNTAQVHFRIIKLDKKTKDSIKVNNSWQDEFWLSLMHLPTVKTYTQPLPATKDYLQHSVEVKLDALPVGEYAVLASIDKEFQLKKNVLAVQFFHISAIAFVNNVNNYFVVNRETGHPLRRANVQVWYQIYNYHLKKRTIANVNWFYFFDTWKNQSTIIELKMALQNFYPTNHVFNVREIAAWRAMLKATGCTEISPFEKEKSNVIKLIIYDLIDF
jgi:hypothetical protein